MVTSLVPRLSYDSENRTGTDKSKTQNYDDIDIIDLCMWRTLLTNKHDNKQHYVQQQ